MENTSNSKKHNSLIKTLIIIVLMALTVAALVSSITYTKDNEIAALKSEHKLAMDQLISKTSERGIITKEKLIKAITSLQPKLDPSIAEKSADTIINECGKKGLDPSLIAALIYVESNFNPFAESGKEAFGLMQIRYFVWKEEPELKNDGVNARGALFWIDKNIIAGTNIFKKYYQESNCDIRLTLYRYNTGKTIFSGNSWHVEYVNKILHYAYHIKTMMAEENGCITEIVDENAEKTIIKEEINHE